MVKKKKYVKQVGTFIGLGIGSAVGAKVISSLGPSATATSATQGIGSFAGMMPAMGTALGGGMALGYVKDLVPKKRRKLK